MIDASSSSFLIHAILSECYKTFLIGLLKMIGFDYSIFCCLTSENSQTANSEMSPICGEGG